MPRGPPDPVVNRLLAALPRAERARVLRRCETVELAFGAVLAQPGVGYTHVYFPLGGFISTVDTVGRHPPLEISLIGAEGMLGATLVLGLTASPLRAIVQGAGSALRMTAALFERSLRESPALLRLLKRYLYVLVKQFAAGSGCHRFHEVDARLARWLLMTHDRAHADHFHLTHVFLAAMLGVRRSGITIAAGALQRKGVIAYLRGEIRVLNRKGLHASACGCYAADLRNYARVMGSPA